MIFFFIIIIIIITRGAQRGPLVPSVSEGGGHIRNTLGTHIRNTLGTHIRNTLGTGVDKEGPWYPACLKEETTPYISGH
jgi:hypothetical protein